MARPDFETVEGRRAYNAELRRVAIGWLCCFVAIAKRTGYHKRRMAGEK